MKAGLRQTLAWAAAIVVMTIWSETFISSKVLLSNGMTPAQMFVIRFSLAYLLIWTFSPKKIFSASVRDELILALLGFAGGSLYFFLENTALEYSTASNVSIIVCCSPLITAILVALVYKSEKMDVVQILGSLIAFVGMALVVLNGKFNLHLNPLGDTLALGAALAWSSYNLIIKYLADKYDSVFITRKVFAYGLLTIVPYIIFVEPLRLDPEVLSRPVVWGNLLYLGALASMACFVLWNWAMSVIGTVRTTNLLYVQPFFTMLIALIILGERITWMAVVGAVILTFGMILAVRKKH